MKGATKKRQCEQTKSLRIKLKEKLLGYLFNYIIYERVFCIYKFDLAKYLQEKITTKILERMMYNIYYPSMN